MRLAAPKVRFRTRDQRIYYDMHGSNGLLVKASMRGPQLEVAFNF